MAISRPSGHEKTKPIYSFSVLLDAYCVNEFEKTKPISLSAFEDGQGDHSGNGFCPAALDDDSDDFFDIFVCARGFFLYFASVAGD